MLKEAFDWEKVTAFLQSAYYAVVVSLLFLVCNMPVFWYFSWYGVENIGTHLPFFLCLLLLLPPSLTAAFSCMDKLINNKERYPFADYFRFYVRNFLPSISIGVLQLGLIFILVTNIRFFSQYESMFPLCVIFGILLFLVILITPNLYLLCMKFKSQNLELFKNAIAILIGRPGMTLGNTAAFLVSLVLFEITSGNALLLLGGVYTFLIVFMNRNLMSELENSEKN